MHGPGQFEGTTITVQSAHLGPYYSAWVQPAVRSDRVAVEIEDCSV